MNRPSYNGDRTSWGRGIARLVTVLGAACLIAYTVSSFQFEQRAALFDTIGITNARAGVKDDSDLARLRLLTRCVGYIRSNYVIPQRIKPIPMLMGALKASETLVPDLMVKPDSDDPELVRSVVIRVGDRQREFQLNGISDLYEMNWKLLDLFEFIAAHLPSDVKADEVEYAAINGLLSPLDEHSVYMPPKAYQEIKLDTRGRFGGLGIVITTRKGLVTVVSVLPDTPAERAGLKSRDRIVEIEKESTINMLLNDSVTRLRGEPGTTVNILVRRKGWAEPHSFSIERAEIHIQSVSSEKLGGGIGYIRIRHFQEDTSTDLIRHMGELEKKGSIDRLILDLRQNPGGLLEQSVEVANLFVREGTIVITEGEGRRLRQEYRADGDAPFADLPMVVLIDAGSASASEIVAAALKGNNRAILLGDTTFGKGTVQIMYEVGDGALKLTIAQYLTPGGISIQGVGIVPDVDRVPVSLDKDFVYLGTREVRRETDPDRSLEPFGKVSYEIPRVRIPMLLDPEPEPETDEGEPPPVRKDEFERDETIRLAEAVVRGIRSPDRKKALKEASSVFEKLSADQDRKIIQGLDDRGIDWTAGPVRTGSPPALHWDMEGELPLQAGDKAIVSLTATNRGTHPLFRVHCSTESKNAAFDSREFVFGRIDPGKSITRKLSIKVPEDSWDRTDRIDIIPFQGDAEGTRHEQVLVATRGLARPRFAYSSQVKDDTGNGDGVLAPGESADVVFDIMNMGPGNAQKLLVTLRNNSGDGLYIRNGRVNFDDGVPVGESVRAKFRVELRREYSAEHVKLEVGILDLALRKYLSKEMTLKVTGPVKRPLSVSKQGSRPLYDNVEPEIKLNFIGGGPFTPVGAEVTLTGTVRFAERSSNIDTRRKILVFRGNDKVFFWTRRNTGEGTEVTLDTVIPMIEGMNNIAVFAIDGQGLSATRRYSVFSETEKDIADHPLPSARHPGRQGSEGVGYE